LLTPCYSHKIIALLFSEIVINSKEIGS
jgi:hypothetical protein